MYNIYGIFKVNEMGVIIRKLKLIENINKCCNVINKSISQKLITQNLRVLNLDSKSL